MLIHSAHGKRCASADVQSMLDVTAALMQTAIFFSFIMLGVNAIVLYRKQHEGNQKYMNQTT